MSKMGRAVLWVQENGLENDPDALKKYIEHLKKQESKKDGNSKDSESGEWKEARDLSDGHGKS